MAGNFSTTRTPPPFPNRGPNRKQNLWETPLALKKAGGSGSVGAGSGWVSGRLGDPRALAGRGGWPTRRWPNCLGQLAGRWLGGWWLACWLPGPSGPCSGRWSGKPHGASQGALQQNLHCTATEKNAARRYLTLDFLLQDVTHMFFKGFGDKGRAEDLSNSNTHPNTHGPLDRPWKWTDPS